MKTSLILASWAAFLAGPLPCGQAQAGESIEAEVAELAARRTADQVGHLWRSAAWGGTSIIVGSALMAWSGRDSHPTRWALGVESVLWGAIDVSIAAAGLLLVRNAQPARSWRALLDGERTYHDVLLFNMGLDVAYLSAGTVMVIASYRGIDNGREWRGHGLGMIVQGLGLFALEAVALRGSRGRLGEIVGLRPSLTMMLPVPGPDPALGLALSGRW